MITLIASELDSFYILSFDAFDGAKRSLWFCLNVKCLLYQAGQGLSNQPKRGTVIEFTAVIKQQLHFKNFHNCNYKLRIKFAVQTG